MINVNQITSELAKMPDHALQQYAAMHKNDPYTVTLALSEANRRKQMRMGAQGAGAMPQPTVVDQDIAQMSPPPQQMAMAHGLPEEQGIGQLPAPNMQGMAGGGIVAFDEGGDVPGYKQGGTSLSTYIDKYAQEYKLDPSVLSQIVDAESKGRTTAKNPESTAHGAGQLLNDMWKKMGGGERGDAETQVRNAAKLLRSNTDNFKNATGREPSAAESYTTWVLGDSTGRAVLGASPNASVEDVIKKADPKHADDIIGKNPSLFKNKSVADVMQWATTKTTPSPAIPVAAAQAATGAETTPSSAVKPKTNPLSNLLPPKSNEPYRPLEELQKNISGAFNVAKQIPSNLYNLATSPEEYFRNINTSNLGPAIIGGFNPSHIGKAGVPNVKAAEAPVAPVVEPAIPTVTESVVSPAVEAARAKQAAARAAVQTQVGQPKPALQTPVEAAQAKQAAARKGLETLLPNNAAPTFPITPESLAAREAAAAKLKAAQPKPATAEGQTFPIEPESEGLAAIQRGKLELERQAEAARKTAAPAETTPITPVEAPAVGEKPISPFDVANATKSRVPSTFPYAEDQNPYVANTTANKYDTGVMGGERQPTAEEGIVAALKEKPAKAIVEPEAKKDSTDWNDLMIKMGLNLMASKDPNAISGVGQAGLGTLGMMQAEEKAKSEREAKMSEADYRKAMGEQARAMAGAIERGAKEKNLQLEAEKLIAQEISKDKFLNMPGQESARAAREAQMRATIYRQLGIEPTMATGASAPAGGFSVVGSRPG
jgi:hypothetical protein